MTDPEGEIAGDFGATRRQAGYVPNVMLALANAAEPFLATRALYRSLMTDPDVQLACVECEVIALVVSVENRMRPLQAGIIEVLRRTASSARMEHRRIRLGG